VEKLDFVQLARSSNWLAAGNWNRAANHRPSGGRIIHSSAAAAGSTGQLDAH